MTKAVDDDLYELFLQLYDAAGEVEDNWSEGHLASAVNWLVETRDAIRRTLCKCAHADGIPPRPGKRFIDALAMARGGGTNPRSIAQAVVTACNEANLEGKSGKRDPAVRLFVAHLAWVCRLGEVSPDLIDACRVAIEAAQPATTADPAAS